MDCDYQNLLINCTEEDYIKNVRRYQAHEISKGRRYFGEYHHLFAQLNEDPNKFREYMRMSIDVFYYILDGVKPLLTRKWCNFHANSAIKEEEQLVVTIRYESSELLKINFFISAC